MPLLSTIVTLHLPKYNLTSDYDSIIISAICKHIKLSKAFLLKLKVIRLIALLDSQHIYNIWLIPMMDPLAAYYIMRKLVGLKLLLLRHLLRLMLVGIYASLLH